MFKNRKLQFLKIRKKKKNKEIKKRVKNPQMAEKLMRKCVLMYPHNISGRSRKDTQAQKTKNKEFVVKIKRDRILALKKYILLVIMIYKETRCK